LELAASFGLLVGLAVLGDALATALRLPVPGPLLGAVGLVVILACRPRWSSTLPAADALISLLPLLFVPLVVAAVGPLRGLGAALGPVALIVTVSTLAGLATTALAARAATWACSHSR
jgi:holin-like protein